MSTDLRCLNDALDSCPPPRGRLSIAPCILILGVEIRAPRHLGGYFELNEVIGLLHTGQKLLRTFKFVDLKLLVGLAHSSFSLAEQKICLLFV